VIAVGARAPLIAFNVNLSTSDLSIANKIAKIVRGSGGGFKCCKAIGVMLEGRNIAQVSIQNPRPKTVVINNIGFLWNFIDDPDLDDVPIEIGGGINLLNSYSIKCLSNLEAINALDFTFLGDYENIEKCVKAVGSEIPTKKMFIAGCLRVESLGLCPLSCDQANISRLSCPAPCHRGHWCLKDPSLKKTFPFVVDGFCKMHMFEDNVIENFEKIPYWLGVGINEFILDFSAIHAPLLPKVLRKYLKAVEGL
jgi:hypothetical protein